MPSGHDPFNTNARTSIMPWTRAQDSKVDLEEYIRTHCSLYHGREVSREVVAFRVQEGFSARFRAVLGPKPSPKCSAAPNERARKPMIANDSQ